MVQSCIWFKEEPSQFSMGETAESNLFRHGETTYTVGWMSENPTLVLWSKDPALEGRQVRRDEKASFTVH